MKETAIDGRPKMRLLEAAFLSILFLALLCLPLLGMIFHIDTAPVWENRRLASFPALSASPTDILHFPFRAAYYFRDNFGFRGGLIRTQALVRVRWLRTPSSPSVILGKDGWLFYSGENLVEYYCGTRPFSEEEMARWLHVMEARRDWLKQRGIAFYFVVAPEKQTIYPDYMPDDFVRVRPDSRLDQLIEYFKAHSTLEIVDLRPTLWAEKSRHRVYHRTNSHWNDLGAFAAYQTLIRKMSQSFPALRPLSETDFNSATEYRADGDLAGILGLNGLMTEEKLNLTPRQPLKALSNGNAVSTRPVHLNNWMVTEKNEANLPRMVMFHDSFSLALIRFLAENFSHAKYVWRPGMNREFIESEAPDVVVLQICERRLMFDPQEDQAATQAVSDPP